MTRRSIVASLRMGRANIRRGLRHIQYRSHLIDGCLAETGLTIRPA